MASVYEGGGKKNRDGNCRIPYFDEHGKRLDVTAGARDKTAAEQIAAELAADVAMRRQGVISQDEARYAEHQRRPLAEHVAEYLAACEYEQQSPVHVKNKRVQLDKLVAGTGATRLADVGQNKVRSHL